MNRHLSTVIIAPMTTAIRDYPSRIKVHFHNKTGQIALDQIRVIDKTRLVEKIGAIDSSASHLICSTLLTMFEY